jgi:hypothetical protein
MVEQEGGLIKGRMFFKTRYTKSVFRPSIYTVEYE